MEMKNVPWMAYEQDQIQEKTYQGNGKEEMIRAESLFTIDRLIGIVRNDLIIKTNVVILCYGRNYWSLL